MNEGSGAVRISLRQADGDHFPVFRHGDPDTRNLSIVPATRDQDEVDIQFFHHPADGSIPRKMGMIRFPDLPAGDDGVELQLDAAIGTTGLLSVSLRHPDSGRVERAEMEIPDDDAPSAKPAARNWRGGTMRWVWGILFVAAGLTLAFYLTRLVTDWGRQEPLEPPVSAAAVSIEKA